MARCIVKRIESILYFDKCLRDYDTFVNLQTFNLPDFTENLKM